MWSSLSALLLFCSTRGSDLTCVSYLPIFPSHFVDILYSWTIMVSKPKSRLHKCSALTVHHLLHTLWDDPESKVRRNLFGYYESKETCQLLDQQVSSMAERSRKAWNFDFLNESPKTGRYVWQKTPSCEVPVWYAAVGRPALKHILRQNVQEMSCENLDCSFADRRTKSPSPKHKENDSQKNEPKKPRFIQTTIKGKTPFIHSSAITCFFHSSDSVDLFKILVLTY